ncbi:PRC-barrel domain-containing protein [Phenylobacterium sp.]|uniref:PRC-barrel domain-containing protein n=1 Tax=Phenylobacterium sp. TaxID=1871053 RepID=UPI0030F39DAA
MTTQAMAKPVDDAEMAHPLIPAQRVNGAEVYNQAKEKIGKIEDIAIDKRTGKVAYAILSFGGFLGMGDKHQPLPWSVLDYDTDVGGYVVDITQEFLTLAPKLDVSELSGWDDTMNRDAFHTYYTPLGAKPYW